jgi:DNA polymerase-1
MITLFDLGAEFWRNALGGKDPILGYEQTLERLDWYRRESDVRRFIVCADSGRSMRKEADPTYKSNRPEKPPEALDALRGVEARVQAWGLKLCKVDGWEADDVIATLTHQAWPEEVTIIGAEKDFYCLLDDERVTLIGKRGPLSSADCVDKFGVAPSQMTDWLCLAGDAADGIPGCAGVGPGKATLLLERFGSAEALLAASDEEILAIKGLGKKTLEGIRAWNRAATLDMVRMRVDLPIRLESLVG